jgi:class 3 adenylate cyclase/tetratricopeptide (TPR) repeat protein
MTCPLCQHENPAEAHFCMKCGTRLTLPCAKCNTELPTGAPFCFACGHPVTAEPEGQRFTSPDAYTPRHLAEKILASKAALEGERKQVTVLFADMKGSMELLADRDPEEARKILDPVLERMMEAVHRYEGTVNQVMGDGIMALFGAPLAHEDHAMRACYAALRMQESVTRYGDEAQRLHGVSLMIRVGLNSGQAVVRAIGNDLRMDYTAVGQTTHLASRMEQMARPGSVLATAATLRLAEGYVQGKPLGSLPIKGLAAPIEVFEIVEASPVRSRMEATAARGLTPFVGREIELDALHKVLERSLGGHGQVVAFVGEPGVGKSRLFWELTRSHRTQGWLILESSSASYGKATPYRPVIDLLKEYCQIEPRDDERGIKEKLTGKLLALDRALEPILTPLLALLDVPVDDASWQAVDPVQRRQRTLEAIKRLLLRESQAQPLCLVLEDLHWIDSETQALLDSMIEDLPATRVLLLLSYRPEYQHSWGSKTYCTQVRIDPLPHESARELLRALLGDNPTLSTLCQHLIAQTRGNPFFLEECVRTLVETQVLVGERGAYGLAQTLSNIQVPATVQAVLAARIDRLPPEERTLLQTAAVIGEGVPFALLQAIAGEPEETLRRGLSQLQAAEFLYEARIFPDPEYSFKHGLTCQVAYGSVLQDRRRALHARVVEAMEQLYPDRLVEHVERLAHHAIRGEQWEKAVAYLRHAGTKALACSANREAVAWFEQALAALARLPETRERLAQGIDLRFDLRNSLVPLGRLAELQGHLRTAENLARALGDRRRVGWVSIYMSAHLWQTGNSIGARAFGEAAHAIGEELQDFALQVAANFYLGQACFVCGEYQRAEDFLKQNVVLLQGGGLDRQLFGLAGFPAILSGSYVAWSMAERGEFDAGLASGQEAVRLAGALEHPYSLILACWRLGCVYSIRGDLPDSITVLERSLAVSREWNVTLLRPYVTWSLGYAYALAGRVAEGLSFLQQAIDGLESMGSAAFSSLAVARLGEACLLADRIEEAASCAERSWRLARERGERGHEAWALRLRGEVAARVASVDAKGAQQHYQEAQVLAAELGMRPLVAHCHLGHGKLYRRTGKWEQAPEHLATATTMYREMDMRFWLGQAEAEMGGLA